MNNNNQSKTLILSDILKQINMFIGILIVILLFFWSINEEPIEPIEPIYPIEAIEAIEPIEAIEAIEQQGVNENILCSNTIDIMKNYNNNNTAIQILQDSTNFQNSLKCYKDVANKLNNDHKQCYQKCMNGDFGLPKASVLCNTACSTDSCVDSYFTGIPNLPLLKKV
jgi:hypothetical protein